MVNPLSLRACSVLFDVVSSRMNEKAVMKSTYGVSFWGTLAAASLVAQIAKVFLMAQKV